MARVRGGEKLEAYIRDKQSKLSGHDTVEVGFLPDKTYPDGTSVAFVAAMQEFGTGTIPPRPFFRNMVAKEQRGWPRLVAENLRANDFNPERTLSQVGDVIVAQLKQSVIDTNDPPLSPTTLMIRKMLQKNPDLMVSAKVVAQARQKVAAGESYAGVSTKPLIYTATMLNSVDRRVKT